MADQAATSFGRLLRRLREEAGLTQEELAEAASLSPRSISDLERGINLTARKDTARLLADALRLTGPQRALFAAAARGRTVAAAALAAQDTLITGPNNLPVQLTRFIGRVAEVAAVRQALATGRLVTLTGPGGIGKSRLGVQAAAGLPAEFPDGLWWVALAGTGDAGQVPGLLAQVIGVRETEGGSLEAALSDRLRSGRTLVVIDNAEHLLPDLADVVVRLLRECGGLTVLATSRESFRVSPEYVLPVPSLAEGDAVALLRERAEAAGASVARSPAIDQLCARLDRLPLALELAAAQLPVFSPAQLLDRLGSRLDLLTGLRDAEPRHRTLRATIQWSHDLLTEPEQVLFRRLAIFAGGCTADAAESVCEAAPGTIGSLLGKSLVRREEDDPEPRLRMLESIGDFAAERLADAGEADILRARHAGYFRTLAVREDEVVRSGEPEEGPVSVLAADIGNLRAAVEYGLAAGDIQLAREITAALRMYWVVRGFYTEARTWLDRALALDDTRDRTRQRLLSALGTIAYEQGDHRTAVAASDEAGQLAMDLEGTVSRFESLDAQGDAAFMRGDMGAAEELYWDALGVALAADNGVGASASRLGLVRVANRTGRYDDSEELLAENLPFVKARGQTRCEGYTLYFMAETDRSRGRPGDRPEVALLGARRALQVDDRRLAVGCLEAFAVAAAEAGDHRRAAALLAAGEAACREMGAEPDGDEDSARAQTIKLLDQRSEAFTLGSAEGRALDLVAALALAEAAEVSRS
jgi:predicted ATPase/transcriptional regulator with XRE-family HTH domain